MNELVESLKTGFIDKNNLSNNHFVPQFLTNDPTMGKKVLATIHKELGACSSFWFSVAFVTQSGVMTIIDLLQELCARDTSGKVLVSQYLNFTEPLALKSLLRFPNIDLRIVTEGDFHAKGYYFKNNLYSNLIIGSSNLTAPALCTNKEWNIKVSSTDNGALICRVIEEFEKEFSRAEQVTIDYINKYTPIHDARRLVNQKTEYDPEIAKQNLIIPNKMQKEALKRLNSLREEKKDRALLISATGTGKTYLSAFDAKVFDPKKLLFIVHRRNIAQKSLNSFKKILGSTKSMGMFSGRQRETDADFIFSTVQTISKDENLYSFDQREFDYIVIDETHRAGAKSYQKILSYFKPKFLLGMTATPERTDGFDIFNQFDYNIAYEIRLHHALLEKMLSPFHYFGVTDVSVGDKSIDDNASFNLLTAEERIKNILEKIEFYGCDDGNVRGLIFCSRVEEAELLSQEFNRRGYKTCFLSGADTPDERELAIEKLESEDRDKIDYIFTVDIFNEGIDIPMVNQVVMLRPTQSAIVFVQQLGRGLRKLEGKDYLTVIDFIGNYSNNYMVPIALYGDTSHNKDTLRKSLASGSRFIPGASTVNFDRISKKRIYEAIDSARLHRKKDLLDDYNLLKFKIGRIPVMVDFVKYGARDPQLYVNYSKSYFNFVASIEDEYENVLSKHEVRLLELFSSEIANGKRVEEAIILQNLIESDTLNEKDVSSIIFHKYGIELDSETFLSAIRNINFEFSTERLDNKIVSVGEKYNLEIIKYNNGIIKLNDSIKKSLRNPVFLKYYSDLLAYSILDYDKSFSREKYFDGFILYKKYSRKDTFRILNWKRNPVAQNVGGYIISDDKSNCPIFVNYHKEETISSTTKYEDNFLSNEEFEWMSKSKRTLKSPDVQTIKNYNSNNMRIPLFIKKHNDEGSDFYYMGDVEPIPNSFVQKRMEDDKGKKVSVVKLLFKMKNPVEDSIYEYITEVY